MTEAELIDYNRRSDIAHSGFILSGRLMARRKCSLSGVVQVMAACAASVGDALTNYCPPNKRINRLQP